MRTAIEHSEKKIVTYFESKAGLGVLQSSPQQTHNLQNFHTKRTESTHNMLLVVCACDILAVLTFVERWTVALPVRSRFQTALIAS